LINQTTALEIWQAYSWLVGWKYDPR